MSVLSASTNSLLLGHVAVGKTQNKTKPVKHCYEFGFRKDILSEKHFLAEGKFFFFLEQTLLGIKGSSIVVTVLHYYLFGEKTEL